MLNNGDIHIRKIEVYEGVMNLIKEGKNLNNIKVSDIAKASNLGKGTIYDYFRTKDEIISEAIIFNMNLKMDSAYKRVKEAKTFKEKYYTLLDVIAFNMEENISLFTLLLSLDKVYSVCINVKDKIEIKNFNFIYEDIYKKGKEEKLISSDKSESYIYMSLGSGILVFSSFLNNTNFYKSIEIEEAMDNSFNIVVNALK